METAELKRGDPEGVCRDYLREKAKEQRGGTSMTVEPGAITKILQERNPEGYPQGFSLGVTHGRQTLQLLLTDAEHPETEVIAQISITEVVEYLKLRMEAQSQQALHLLAKLETYKEKP